MTKFNSLYLFCLIFLIGISGCSSDNNTVGSNPMNPGLEPTRVVVRILNLDLVLTAFPTPTQTSPPPTPEPVILPSATPTPNMTSMSSTDVPTPACSNRAEFVKHLTVSDRTALEPGQIFVKMWQIRNTGTCTWDTDYTLVFYSGEKMGAPPSLPLDHAVSPGETIDLTIHMVAPLNTAFITGNWVLQDPNGNIFGFGESGDKPIAVTIFVKPTPMPTSG
jgi:hypothetical protein